MPCSPLWIFALLLLLAPLAVFVNLLPLLRQRKLLKGVRNYDAGLHRFLFRIDMTPEEFWNRLRLPNAADVLEYDLSDDASVITFRRYKGRLSCRLRPEAHDTYIILRLETAQHPFVQTGGAQFYVNSFWIQKFGAVPLVFVSMSAARSGGAARYFKLFHITKQILNSPTCADRHP